MVRWPWRVGGSPGVDLDLVARVNMGTVVAVLMGVVCQFLRYWVSQVRAGSPEQDPAS